MTCFLRQISWYSGIRVEGFFPVYHGSVLPRVQYPLGWCLHLGNTYLGRFFLVAIPTQVRVPESNNESFDKIYHHFINFCEFDIWLHVYSIYRCYHHLVSINTNIFKFLLHVICLYDDEAWIIYLHRVQFFSIQRCTSLDNVKVNFVTGITNLVRYFPLLLIVL